MCRQRRARGAVLGLVTLLAACGGEAPPPQTRNLSPIRLAEVCRMSEAIASVDAQLQAMDPQSLRYLAALQDKAVLLRDTNQDAAASELEATVAQLDGRPAGDVRDETMRDVAALRQRRATSIGKAAC